MSAAGGERRALSFLGDCVRYERSPSSSEKESTRSQWHALAILLDESQELPYTPLR